MTFSTRHTYPCLFCRDESRNRTEEHIIQHGFNNSRWTLPTDVCTCCNSKIFSPLDTELINFARKYVYPNHPGIISHNRTLLQTGHSVQLDEGSRIWQSIRIENDGRPFVFPQLIVVDENKINFLYNFGQDGQNLFEQIKQDLSQPDSLSLSDLVFTHQDQSLPPIQPAIIRSAKRKYVVRASTIEKVHFLKTQIESGQLLSQFGQNQSEPQRIIQQSEVWVNQILDIRSINRAIAKSAINSMCAFLGSERARNHVFDPIKSFVLGRTEDVGENFVQHLWNKESTSQAHNFGVCGYHTVLLAPTERIPTVLFLLYESLFALVRLTDVTNFLGEEEIFAALINYRSGSHEVLSPQSDPVGFYHRFYMQ
ncbi:hypothetical protein NIES25_38350 [Nostoc linckia NIES-25]|nr:hypothetical protein NIES25_38350 [Nostoc linckia NIES-25]